MSKKVWKAKQVINNWQDKPIKAQLSDDPFDENTEISVREMTVRDAMLIIANNFDCKKMEDSEKKRMLKEAIKESMKSGRIKLDHAVHKWLKAASEQVSPTVWQDNAEMVHAVIEEGGTLENEPSKSRKAKTGKEGKNASEKTEQTEPRPEEK